VDWTKLKLKTAVIATAAAPHARTFKLLFIKVFMILSSPVPVRRLHYAGAVVMVLYITTSLDECQGSSLENL
jgi:hypothetical protein